MILDVPTIKCFVPKGFFTASPDEPITEFLSCYLVAVTTLQNNPLLWTVHTEDGALFSRLPTHAIWFDLYKGINPEKAQPLPIVEPWECLNPPAQVIQYKYLENYPCSIISPKLKGCDALYLFTIDYFGEGLARDPEQHKTHNILASSWGQMLALPNNYCVFKDLHFTNQGELSVSYRRQLRRWRIE